MKPDPNCKRCDGTGEVGGDYGLTPSHCNCRRQYRHKKRGTLYQVIGVAELQISLQNVRPVEGDHLVIYRGEDGKMWARMSSEFHDGRFEVVEG